METLIFKHASILITGSLFYFNFSSLLRLYSHKRHPSMSSVDSVGFLPIPRRQESCILISPEFFFCLTRMDFSLQLAALRSFRVSACKVFACVGP
jgi:hypothetical protein